MTQQQRTFADIQTDVERDLSIRNAAKFQQYAIELDEVGTVEAQALAWRLRGLDLYRGGNFRQATELFHRSVELYEQLGDVAGVARVLSNIAVVMIDQDALERPLEVLTDVLTRFKQVEDLTGVANTLNSIGIILGKQGLVAEALEHHLKALDHFEQTQRSGGVALALGNIAHIYHTTGRYVEALEASHRALSLLEDLGDMPGVALMHGAIGSAYYQTADYPRALEHHHQALAIHEANNDILGIARTTSNIGNVYNAAGNHEQALMHYGRVSTMEAVSNDPYIMSTVVANIGIVHKKNRNVVEALEHLRRSLLMKQQLDDNAAILHVQSHILDLLVLNGEIAEAEELLSTLDASHIENPGVVISIEMSRALLHEHHGRIDEAQRTLLSALEHAQHRQLPELLIGLHHRLRDLALQRQDFAAYVEHNNEFTRITEETAGKEIATKLAMQAKQREIDAREREHEKQLAVLHSTLPKEVAERVARGEVVNDHYENATVIFLDIVGFTDISSSMSSQEVIELLDDVFTQCDAICKQHNVTKIKTIGDSYMCVSFDNVVNAALCALEMSRINISHEVSHSVSHAVSHEVLFRIGMHCGPVTAGVIGKERMQYDVWGDTVNVASRMESAGEPGRVHVSEALAIQLKANTEYTIQNPISESENPQSHEVSHSVSHNVSHSVSHNVSHSVSQNVSHDVPLVTRHSSLVTIERGSIEIKGKGPMNTYWLEAS